MVFIQNIVKDNHIYPYDMGFRLSGTQEHIILEEVCGYNPLKLLTQYSIDKTFGDQNLNSKINPNFKECACNITFLAKSSKIGKFIGLEQVQNIEGVIRVVKNKDIGEEIPQNALGTLNQIVLRVFAKAPTKEKLLTLINEIKSIVKVLDESGENILIEDNKID